MRKLSLWAKNNTKFARIIIVISHILLIWIAAEFAMQFSAAGVQISVWWIYFFVALFIAVGLLYPSKRNKKTQWNYIRQKCCDFAAGVCSFCLVCCFINQLNTGSFYQTANAYIGGNHSAYKNPAAEKLLQDFKDGQKKFFTRKEKRIIKTEFRYQLKQYAESKLTNKKDQAEQALLIILSCIAALGLFILVASLACSLSCSGSETAGTIVLILGTIGIIWGLIVVIKIITRKQKKSPGSSEIKK